MNIEKDNKLLLRHFIDLANTSYFRNIPVFTDFLNLNEMSLLEYGKKDLPKVAYGSYGGFADAERKMFCFYQEINEMNAEDFYPIKCLKISPLNHKFSDDLSHRDFLGAILNLGIDRAVIGDILMKDNVGFLFCKEEIADFICDQLTKIKHTFVSVSVTNFTDCGFSPKLVEMSGTIASERLDTLIAFALQGSRSSLKGLIPAGKVFVNNKLILSESYQPKEQDIISVRGYGKFIYLGTNKTTKKGRLSVTIQKYVN